MERYWVEEPFGDREDVWTIRQRLGAPDELLGSMIIAECDTEDYAERLCSILNDSGQLVHPRVSARITLDVVAADADTLAEFAASVDALVDSAWGTPTDEFGGLGTVEVTDITVERQA